MMLTTSAPLTLAEIIATGAPLTPMMQQYAEIKSQHHDTLVLYRMGDFYELFFEDARRASELLNITLTHRGKLGEFPIPMAGIPHHAASNYIDRLTNLGLKVVICEQMENPKEAKGLVARAVSQIVGPAMPFEIDKVEAREHRFLAAGCAIDSQNLYLVLIDYTTGLFKGVKCRSEDEWIERFNLYMPKEFVTFMGQWEKFPFIEEFLKNRPGLLKTHLNQDYFRWPDGKIYLEKIVTGLAHDKVLKQESGILPAMCALAHYLLSTQGQDKTSHLRPFQMESEKGLMRVTSTTLQGLEIIPRHRDEWGQTLLGFMDKTKTALGPRLLVQFFQRPLRDLKSIKGRQNLIAHLHENFDDLEKIRIGLVGIRDLERLMAKVSTGKATAQDLLALAQSQTRWEELGKTIQTPSRQLFEVKLSEDLVELNHEILSSLNPEMGATLEKGNLFIEGKFPARDKLAKLATKGAQAILELESHYREKTGISNLKIKTNNISGYFFEVSKSHLNKVPKNFERRQTLVNAERFSNEELEALEKNIITAQSKLEVLDRELFNQLVEKVKGCGPSIQKLAENIAKLDVFQSLSFVAHQEDFCCPQIHPSDKQMVIKGGFHPLIKSHLRDHFITHDLTLSDECPFALITGPNMAGKTTVMREMAIIQFLAQIGSYVPAQSAELGLCDALFSRLGAHDNILHGQSTFMVEMSETAEILRHATHQSLIILDELGRGTSTYDGLSLAWSLVEYFVQKTKALTLFSTHYHELIEVVQELNGAKNLTVETLDRDGEVTFLYKLIEKGASQSYGIHVAKLAGVPMVVLQRAKSILNELESEHHHRHPLYSEVPSPDGPQLSLLDLKQSEKEKTKAEVKESVKVIKETPDYLEKIQQEIVDFDLANMTPIKALQELYQIQQKLNSQIQ